MAENLRIEPPCVDRILCSTASRARETLAIIRPALPSDLAVDFSDDLYALGLQAYHAAARRHRACAGVLLVGHNPTIEEFVAAFCASGSPQAFETIRQGVGTAHWLTIELPGGDTPSLRLHGILRGVRTP